MRHGPHHGAQKSTTTGRCDEATAASNAAASGVSTGTPGAASGAWHLPQRVCAVSRGYARRLRWPHEGHGTTTPFESSCRSAMLIVPCQIADQAQQLPPVLDGAGLSLDFTASGASHRSPQLGRPNQAVERRRELFDVAG